MKARKKSHFRARVENQISMPPSEVPKCRISTLEGATREKSAAGRCKTVLKQEKKLLEKVRKERKSQPFFLLFVFSAKLADRKGDFARKRSEVEHFCMKQGK